MGIVDESPASQLSHPSDPKKFACVLVREGSNLQWYTFDIDDDDKHNQSLHHDTNCGAEKILMPKAWSADRGVGWAIMGQTLYHVRRESMLEILKARPVQIPGNRLEWFDITTGKTPMAMETEWIKASPRMPNHVVRVHTMVLDGKIYCLGGYLSPTPEKKIKAKEEEEEEEQPPRPWAMAYDPSLDKWESLPDPPYRPAAMNLNVFSAAVAALGLLVVGCPSKGLLQLYRTDTMVWELDDKFDMRSRIFPRDLLWGPTLAVNTMLYWYGIKSARLGAYDLVTKTWFVASLPIHDHHDYWDFSAAHYPPKLAYLGAQDKFCLFWVSSDQCPHEDCVSRLHCLKFQLVNTTNNLCPESGFTPLEVSSLSCQSYLVSGVKDFSGALVGDGHLGIPHFRDGHLESNSCDA